MKNNIPLNFTGLVITIFVFFLISSDLYSQEITKTSLNIKKQLPIFKNFRFFSTDVIQDPFINTHLKVNVGTGEALGLKSYLRDLSGEIIDTLSGDLNYVSGGFRFQYAINEQIAVNVAYGGFARLGSNAYTLLTSGVSYSEGFTIGGKMKLLQSDRFFISGSIDYSLNEVYLYSIYDFVKTVAESDEINDSTNGSLLQKENLPELFFNANFAAVPLKYLGILGIAGFGFGKPFESKVKGIIRLGGAALVDLQNISFISFPIGVLASVRYNSFSESGENLNDLFTFGFQISYTGHQDFDIGIESILQSINYSRYDQRIKTLLTQFKMLYYF